MKKIKLIALLLVLTLLFAGCNLQQWLAPYLPNTDNGEQTAPTPTDPIVTPQNPIVDDDPVVDDPIVDDPTSDDPVVEDPIEEELPARETIGNFTYDVIHVFTSEVNVVESGIYNKMEEVAAYIYLFGKLPSNYSTDSSYVKKYYTQQNKLSYTGGTFYNREGLLPTAVGRTFTELDIGYTGGSRNALRIVYSSDGLIFYTSDHYASFSLVRVHNDVD